MTRKEIRWSPPEPGDILWCRFPERPRGTSGPKPRPALVLEVVERSNGVEVTVAYGTSRKLDRLRQGEFSIQKALDPAAYALAGLSYDTKFDLGSTVCVPWNEAFFAVAPGSRLGHTPKLGSLHSGMMKVVYNLACILAC